MKALVLVPWAPTAWSESGRCAARTPLPLTDGGRALAESWGRELADSGLQTIYTSEEQTSQETAQAVASGSGARVRTMDGIEEVSFGLWEGLTEESLKSRFPKAYKRWKEDPSSVCPPEGEGIEAAAQRMRKALRTVQRKAERTAVGLVLGPVACAIVHCELQRGSLARLRDFVLQGPFTYVDLEGVLQPAVRDEAG